MLPHENERRPSGKWEVKELREVAAGSFPSAGKVQCNKFFRNVGSGLPRGDAVSGPVDEEFR